MESNGKKSRIHLSQETADLLIAGGKAVWVTQREDKVFAKGKGEMQTYWLELADKLETSSMASGSGGAVLEPEIKDEENKQNVDVAIEKKTGVDAGKCGRLVDWNVEVLLRLLKQVVARRESQGRKITGVVINELELKPARGQTVLDEVKEIITLPQFDASTGNTRQQIDSVDIDAKAAEQLHDYVTNVASMYRNNPCKFLLRGTDRRSQPPILY